MYSIFINIITGNNSKFLKPRQIKSEIKNKKFLNQKVAPLPCS